MNHTPTSYDEVAYDSYPFTQAHPDRLAAIATLFGLNPPRVATARVLELGCASGGHLIPLADALPDARFTGVDLSSRQIAAGQETVRAAGLHNIELRHASILDVGREWGEYDYIICHGVFSWVPDEVRAKILTICHEQLAPQGVAYVSYNVHPGWRLRGMLRDMMCYHARRFPEPEKRVQQAQALLDFLAHAAVDQEGPYGLLLKRELEVLSRKPATYLLHEFLEDVNEPLYFHQFAAQAEAHGLQYLGEARLPAMASWNLPRAVQETLARVASNVIEQEQYLDFVRNRAFRETLLCHAGVAITRQAGLAAVERLRVAAAIKPVPVDVADEEPVEFPLHDGTKVATRDRTAKGAYSLLAQRWPQSVPFAELRGDGDGPGLARRLLTLAARTEAVRLCTEPGAFTCEVSARPRASALARHEAAMRGWCTNRLHEVIQLNAAESELVALLDGTRTREELGPQAEPLLRSFARRALLVS